MYDEESGLLVPFCYKFWWLFYVIYAIFFMECVCNFGDVILNDFIAYGLYILLCNHDMDIFR